MNDNNLTPTALQSLVRELQALKAAAGPNKHDQGMVCISACIDAGITKGAAIIALLATLDFDKRHIGKLLHDETGPNPERHRWWRDEAGHLHCHPGH